MNSFHNIMESSKINKNNKKAKNMEKYKDSLQSIRWKEDQKLQNLKNSIKDIEKKIEFNQIIDVEEDLPLSDSNSNSKDIFFSKNLDINSLLSNFDTLNELSKSGINEKSPTDTFDDNISLHSMNLNIVPHTNRFNIESNIISNTNNRNLDKFDYLNSISNEKSLMIKTVAHTLEENEWKREILSETRKEINTDANKEIYIENKEIKMDTSILSKIQIINIVYKESYKNKFVSGFGDFLRGSFFILEFCRKNKIKYNFLIYHPIHQFFKNPSVNRDVPNSILDSIEYCEYCNIKLDVNCTFNPDISTVNNEFFNYLNRQDIFNRNLFIYTICYPTMEINNENKQIVKKMIEPIPEIENSIQNILSQLKLIKKNFFIIQIRTGDEYLKNSNNNLTNEYKEKVLFIVKNIIQNKKKPFLLIADNFLVKHLIIHHFPFIKTFFKEITHLGENSSLPREKIKNTLIDFYIMSYACGIFSLSTYEHGSGFSRWCSVTYDIPYKCIKI